MKLLVILATILSSVLTNLEQKTLQTDFTLSVSEEVNQPINYTGTVVLNGERFRINLFGLDAAYDGQTLYIYSAETDELTLSHPTEQELLETNPLLYARYLADRCTVTEKTADDGRCTYITLVPKEPTDPLTRLVMRVRSNDLMPLSIEMREGKTVSTLRFTNPAFVTTETEYILRPEKETFVNDLR